MKKTISKVFTNPKKVIPVAAVIVVVASLYIYNNIGKSPEIPSSILTTNNEATILPGSNVSLSFAQSGRLQEVLVKTGDNVHKGQVLAKLSAPQAEGAVSQAKGALDLALAQYASLNIQYKNAKKQQDLIVQNAYRTLLSSGLEGVSSVQDQNTPIISGTYTCDKEGIYVLKPYTSGDEDTQISINFSGIEKGVMPLKYNNPVPLGNCGLQVKFLHVTNFNPLVIWTISIPNTKSSTYLANKNAYDLAVETREKVLSELSANLGEDDANTSVAKAQIDAAKGAYEQALGAYQNYIITSPVEGIVNFIDSNLKVGQSISANKSIISISAK